jgi:hypothetical protein
VNGYCLFHSLLVAAVSEIKELAGVDSSKALGGEKRSSPKFYPILLTWIDWRFAHHQFFHSTYVLGESL